MKTLMNFIIIIIASIFITATKKVSQKMSEKLYKENNSVTQEGTTTFTLAIIYTINGIFVLIGYLVAILLVLLGFMVLYDILDIIDFISCSVFLIVFFLAACFFVVLSIRKISYNEEEVCFGNIVTKRKKVFKYEDVRIKQKSFAIFVYANKSRIPINTQYFSEEDEKNFEAFCNFLKNKIGDRYVIID